MNNSCERSGPSGPPRIFKKWLRLLFCVACIALFVSVVAPALGNISGIRTAVAELRENDMDAGAYFYTNVEQVREAELYVRHSFQFSSNR